MADDQVDVLLIGGGVMSTTLGIMLNQLDPNLKVMLVEQLDQVAHESTHGWNNAGTGHAGYCELNYTPEDESGRCHIGKALGINADFEVSLQLWSYLVEQRILPDPHAFINATPHQSFVWGENHVAFLRKRYQLLKAHHLFADMQYTEDPSELKEWMPLIMEGRDHRQPVAATRVDYGADVDFGALTRSMAEHLRANSNTELALGHTVVGMSQRNDGRWQVRIRDEKRHKDRQIDAGFVFIGAGGASLPLLQKSGIKESSGYGGFPVTANGWCAASRKLLNDIAQKFTARRRLGHPPCPCLIWIRDLLTGNRLSCLAPLPD